MAQAEVLLGKTEGEGFVTRAFIGHLPDGSYLKAVEISDCGCGEGAGTCFLLVGKAGALSII